MGTIYVCFSQGNSSLQACLNLDHDSPTPLHPALRLWAFVCVCVCVFVGEGFMSAETFWHVVTEEAQV